MKKKLISAVLSVCILLSTMSGMFALPASALTLSDVGDGVADATAAIQDAINGMSGGGELNIPQGTYRITADINIDNPNLILKGTNATLISDVGKTICATRCAEISNLAFNNVAIYLFPTNTEDALVIKNNSFTGSSAGISQYSRKFVTISNNYFESTSFPILLTYANKCTVNGNTMINNGYNIAFYGSDECMVYDNYTDGGVVGIGFCANRQIHGANTHQLNNIVTNNIVKNPSEEGISFDCAGSGSSSSSVINGLVNSNTYSGSSNYIYPDFALSASAYTNYYLTFVTGPLKDETYLIDHMGNNGTEYLRIANAPNVNITGERFLIHAPSMGNTVTNNVVENAGTGGIVLWGTGINNTITDNVVITANNDRDAICAYSARGMQGNSVDYGPAIHNTIENNKIYNGKIVADTVSYNGQYYMSSGNRVINNESTGISENQGIRYQYQENGALENNTFDTLTMTAETAKQQIKYKPENRKYFFDVNYYNDMNPEVKAAYNNDLLTSYNHYLTKGVKEGRAASPVFDIGYYKANNPDLVEMYGSNNIAYIEHWINYGIAEGRKSSPTFDLNAYISLNPDLQSIYGSNKKAYLDHYLSIGINEGRLTGECNIVNVNSGKSMEVASGSMENGGNIAQWESTGNQNQKWYFVLNQDDTYKIVSANSGKCVDVTGSSNTNGANIQQYDYWGGANQKWLITPNGDTSYKILSVGSGKCIDVEGASVNNGANIYQWDYSGMPSQKWYVSANTKGITMFNTTSMSIESNLTPTWSTQAGNDAAKLMDIDDNTFVDAELTNGAAYITIDMQSEKNISGFSAIERKNNGQNFKDRFIKNFELYYSTEKPIYNGTAVPSQALTKIGDYSINYTSEGTWYGVNFKTVNTRYLTIKVTSLQGDTNVLNAGGFAVGYNVPPTNWNDTGMSVIDASSGINYQNLLTNAPFGDNGWDYNAAPAYLTIDLGSEKTVDEFKASRRKGWDNGEWARARFIKDFDIYVTNTNPSGNYSALTDADKVRLNGFSFANVSSSDTNEFYSVSFPQKTGRYMTIYVKTIQNPDVNTSNAINVAAMRVGYVNTDSTIYTTGVTLNTTTASIQRLSWTQLTATVSPSNAQNQEVTWTSSNTAVATVSANGLVTGVSAGTATIKVTTVDTGLTATCSVTVNPIPVASVSLDITTLVIGKQVTKQLTATFNPSGADNKAVVWSSSNDTIAMVSQTGIVTGVGVGTATITVTTVDGGKTATCAVTVKRYDPTKYYKITYDANSVLAMDVTTTGLNGAAKNVTYTGAASQQWQILETTDSSTFKIVNKATGYALKVNGSNSTGVAIIQSNYSNTNSMNFTIPESSGYVQIYSKLGTKTYIKSTGATGGTLVTATSATTTRWDITLLP